ncbi:MAG TPA: nuclear transport factor 2 family protein [Vicinamibacterales bacterium]|nr:nuclear transport factor 2 family protein [Vicinamibacterales bacterium]
MMNLFTLSLVSLVLVTAGAGVAQTKDPEAAAVRTTIEDHYFRAQATGDGSHLKGTFIEEGRMMWIADGQLRTRTSGDYIAGFQGRPPADEAKRRRRVVMVDVAGDAAVAKVELDFPDTKITDYFSLLKIGEDWKIVHKWFHRQPRK